MLRDFSKGCRVGELAQGINYHFAKNVLGCKAIEDYDEYLKKHGLKHKGGRKPDYVVTFNDKSIGIIESKGSSSRNPTSMLKSGLQQCSNGKRMVTPRPKRTYSSAVWFATDGPRMQRDTAIHYIDPFEESEHLSDDEFRQALLREYAKWFCIAGRYDDAKKLRESSSDKFHLEDAEENKLGYILGARDINYVDRKNKIFQRALVKFGISKPLKNFLTNPNEHDMPLGSEAERILDDKGIAEKYADGTWIKFHFEPSNLLPQEKAKHKFTKAIE